jgi:hypothetical protein
MKAFALFLVCSFPHLSNAQFIQGDTSFLAIAQSTAILRYEKSLGMESMLYQGTEYFAPKQTSDSHPFLIDDWVTGDLVYFGESFRQIPMMYDITTNKLIIESGHGTMMALINEKISAFTLHDQHFQLMGETNNLPQPGFYELLYPGRSTVLALRQKKTIKKIESSQVNLLYSDKTQYFVFSNGTYHLLTGKRQILEIFYDHKSEIRKFIKKKGFSFSKDPARAFTEIAATYDVLKSTQ